MVNSLLLAMCIRTLLVIVSYGCKVPAGIFVPSMAIGATFGRMVGIIVKAMYRFVVPLCFAKRDVLNIRRAYPTSGIFAVCQPDIPCITPGTYAFLGAAAALRWVVDNVSFLFLVLFTELVAQWRYANDRYRRGHHVRTHRRPDIHLTNYGSFLFLKVGSWAI